MITTIKTCAICGEGGAATTIAITYPDTSATALPSAAILPALAPAATTTGTGPIKASAAGGETSRTYSNASILSSEDANTGIPAAGGGGGGDVGLASSGSSPKQPSVAGSGEGTTGARSADVPVVTSSAAASDSFAAAQLSGIGRTATLNTSVAGPTETLVLKYSSNGAGGLCFGLGGVSFAFFVAILLLQIGS
jgi:hypothetical protein